MKCMAWAVKNWTENKKSIFVEINQYWKGNNDYLDVFKILKGEEQGLAVTWMDFTSLYLHFW